MNATVTHEGNLLFIWRDHLCTPVVLFGDGVITFLTCRIPAQTTKPSRRSHNMHVSILWMQLSYITYHICTRTLIPSSSSVFILKSTPAKKKRKKKITFNSTEKQSQQHITEAICDATANTLTRSKWNHLCNCDKLMQKSCFVLFSMGYCVFVST